MSDNIYMLLKCLYFLNMYPSFISVTTLLFVLTSLEMVRTIVCFIVCVHWQTHQMYPWLRTIVDWHVIFTGKTSTNISMVTDNSWFKWCVYCQTFTKCTHGCGHQFVHMLCLLANLHQIYPWLRTTVSSHVVFIGKPSPIDRPVDRKVNFATTKKWVCWCRR